MEHKNSPERNNLYRAWAYFINNKSFLTNYSVRPVIAASWKRCSQQNVNPFQPIISKLSQAELDQANTARQNMVNVARPYMQSLYNLVKGSGFVVTLCDEKGNLLELLGDDNVLKDASNINLVPGVNWAEAFMGTTAIGITLEIKAPVQVCSAEHFCQPCHEWTCSAAPIQDPQGKMLGALNMSGHYLKAHPHTLGMVVAAARAIEQQMKTEEFADNLMVNNRYLKTMLESISDGLIAIDREGQIKFINSVAAHILDINPRSVPDANLSSALLNQLKMNEVFKQGAEITDSEISLDYNGKKIHCTVTAKPISQENDSTAGAVITLREIKNVRRLVHRMIGARALFIFEDILTNNSKMIKTIELAKLAANNNYFNILLLGDSGTGKELFAQAIHNASPRHKGPFVAINCAAIPKELIGSEMFGYTEGAFTGAKSQGSPGKFELADGGTILLDEIGDMPLDMQAVLLRVIQERTIVRIGGRKVIPINVRIISASNKNLAREIKKGNFRSDLFYRLNEFPLHIPSLRERPEDISLLAIHFLERLNKNLGRNLSFTSSALRTLEAYQWPGNVRELENLIQQITCTHTSDRAIEDSTVKALLQGGESKKDEYYSLSLQEKEISTIKQAMMDTRGNMTRAAKALGIGRTTLYRKIKKYELK